MTPPLMFRQEFLKHPEGVTLNRDGTPAHLTGFAVSITNKKLRVADVVGNTEEFKRAIENILRTASDINAPAYIGSWKSGEDVFIDVTLNTEMKTDALALARVFGQLAIFDFRNMCEVMIN